MIMKKEPWGHKRLGMLSLEYDGSIVMGNQVVGKIAPDYFTPEEVNDVCKELVRRWNYVQKHLDIRK
jgi:coenzyme F420-reducing hydrogenase alpha subunit